MGSSITPIFRSITFPPPVAPNLSTKTDQAQGVAVPPQNPSKPLRGSGVLAEVTTPGSRGDSPYSGVGKPSTVNSVTNVMRSQRNVRDYVGAMSARFIDENPKIVTNSAEQGRLTTATLQSPLRLGGGLSLPKGTASSQGSIVGSSRPEGVFTLVTPSGKGMTISSQTDNNTGAGRFTLQMSDSKGTSEPLVISGVPVIEKGEINVWRSFREGENLVSRKFSLVDSLKLDEKNSSSRGADAASALKALKGISE